jgi:hypothetical protein
MECTFVFPGILSFTVSLTLTNAHTLLYSDLDYEYPGTSAQGQGLADLVTSLRTALTQLASRKGDTVPYLITAAVGAGPQGYSNLKVSQMNAAMDYWNLMVRSGSLSVFTRTILIQTNK